MVTHFGKLVSVGSPRSYTLFIGTESVPVFLAMVWYSSLTMSDRTRHNRLGTYCESSVRKRCINFHTLRIWHTAISSVFRFWRSTCQGIGSPAMKVPSLGRRNRDIRSLLPELTNLSYAMRSASTVTGTMVKEIAFQWHLYCILSVLKSWLWFVGAVNLVSDLILVTSDSCGAGLSHSVGQLCGKGKAIPLQSWTGP
jgi:hypothetical protein